MCLRDVARLSAASLVALLDGRQAVCHAVAVFDRTFLAVRFATALLLLALAGAVAWRALRNGVVFGWRLRTRRRYGARRHGTQG